MIEAKARPLSPHLGIYKKQLTSGMSILHRFTGIGLTFGVVVFVAWLTALANGEEAYADFTTYAQSLVGQALLFGFTAALFYHLCNGIRHLAWDSGAGLDIKTAYKTGYAVFAVAILLTALIWLCAYGVFS